MILRVIALSLALLIVGLIYLSESPPPENSRGVAEAFQMGDQVTENRPIASARTAMTDPAAARQVLQRLQGQWQSSVVHKVSSERIDSGTRIVEEHSQLVGDLLLYSRESSQPDRVKSLTLMNFAAEQGCFFLRTFRSQGQLCREWRLSWDEQTSAFTGEAVDLPFGWTSRLVGHFAGDDGFLLRAWIKDAVGGPRIDMEAFKKRQTDPADDAFADSWNSIEKSDMLPSADADRSVADARHEDWEEILNRLAGTWHSAVLPENAAATPEVPSREIQRSWILNHRMILEHRLSSGKIDQLTLTGYNPELKLWQRWSFDTTGHAWRAEGTWEPNSETLTFESFRLDGGQQLLELRLSDPNQVTLRQSILRSDGTVMEEWVDSQVRRASAH